MNFNANLLIGKVTDCCGDEHPSLEEGLTSFKYLKTDAKYRQ